MFASLNNRRSRVLALAAGITGFLLLLAGYTVVSLLANRGESANAERAQDEEFPTTRVFAQQAPLPAPPARPVRDLTGEIKPDELVLGVAVNGQARAYPLNVLDGMHSRKVFNDTLAGRPIAVTF